MDINKVLSVLFISVFLLLVTGCVPADQEEGTNRPESGLIEDDSDSNLITDQPTDVNSEEFSANATVYTNEAAGYEIAYVDGIDIDDQDPKKLHFTREDINLTVETLENSSEYDLVSFISLKQNFPYYYQLADFSGRNESGKKLVFTGKGSDALSPIYYFSNGKNIYKITATNDEAKVLDYIASTLKFR